jgi:hypothetical protein
LLLPPKSDIFPLNYLPNYLHKPPYERTQQMGDDQEQKSGG